MSDPLSQRLSQVRHHLGFTTNEMATCVGLKDRQSWERYERGETSPKADVLSHIANMGVNTNWLLTGTGLMQIATNNLIERPAADDESVLKIIEMIAEELLKVIEKDRLQSPPDHVAEAITACYRMLKRSHGQLQDDSATRYMIIGLLSDMRRLIRG